MKASSPEAAIEKADRSLVSSDEAIAVRHYAVALVDAAAAEKQAETALAELEAIEREVFGAYPDFKRVLESSRVSSGEKDRILVKVFGDRVSSVVLRFL